MFLQKMSIFLLLFYYYAPLQAEISKKKNNSREHVRKPNDSLLTQQEARMDALSREATHVRIGLRLTAFSQSSAEQKMPRQSVPQALGRYTLKARLAQPDHFYFSNFHVQTIPLAWTNASGSYRVQLIFGKRNPAGVEEELGLLELEGSLHRDGESYILHGIAEKRFDDKTGNPVLNVLAGFRQTLAADQRVAGRY